MNAGQIVIDAVIRAGAIDRVENVEDHSCIIIWKANASEQIEAALAEAGCEVKKSNPQLCRERSESEAAEGSASE